MHAQFTNEAERFWGEVIGRWLEVCPRPSMRRPLELAVALDPCSGVCSRRPRRSILAVEPAPGGRGARFLQWSLNLAAAALDSGGGSFRLPSNRPVRDGIESSIKPRKKIGKGR